MTGTEAIRLFMSRLMQKRCEADYDGDVKAWGDGMSEALGVALETLVEAKKEENHEDRGEDPGSDLRGAERVR